MISGRLGECTLNAPTPMPDDGRHAVAVVRVEIRDGTKGELLIELIEVSREHDRLLGRATNTADACRVLESWLRDLSNASPGPA
jgi:hypothetical protein